MPGEVKYTTNHEVIRSWVEARGGWPAKFLRIHFHGYVTRGAPPRVDWGKFFQAFEERGMAFLYQDHTATGKQSHFFRLVYRRVDPVVSAPPSMLTAAAVAEDPLLVKGRSALQCGGEDAEEMRGEVA
jgi:hypothetical protein